tara:strand:+ start:1905 stop:2507 length:603 start_codon:yes stop_codon:yes gene_type:complete
MSFKLEPLFAYPVMITDERYNLKEEERNFIELQDSIFNGNNNISSNRYILDEPNLEGLKRWIKFYVSRYYFDVMQFTDSEPYITQSWVNFTKMGERHGVHCHPNSFLSGVFYLDENETQIEFSNYDSIFKNLEPRMKQGNIFNSHSWRYPTKKNALFLFPSTLWHSVSPNQNQKTRISISFNTWIKGEMGREEDLTSLKL